MTIDKRATTLSNQMGWNFSLAPSEAIDDK
jgi:hypothetical protein